MDKYLCKNASKPLKIGLTFNVKKGNNTKIEDEEAEYDSMDTVYAIKKALEATGDEVVLLEATKELPAKLNESKPDIVFNIAEGTNGRGREAQVPAILDMFGIPYTGSDATTLCIALDKALAKRLLATYHIKSPKYQLISGANAKVETTLKYPLIVKPNAEGSSKGISGKSIVTNKEELTELLNSNINLYKEDMLVEEYIDGREFTVALIGNGDELKVFPPMEIIYKKKKEKFNIYSYQVKKNYKEYISYECPARLDDKTQANMVRIAKRIYEVLNCRDFSRIDFRMSQDGGIYFIEINPLPGLAPGYSDYPMIAGFNGVEYDTLVRQILLSALKRYGLNN